MENNESDTLLKCIFTKTTVARKNAVCKVHKQNNKMRKDSANLMNLNSEETAKKVYCLEEKEKNAGKTSAALQRIFRQDSSNYL